MSKVRLAALVLCLNAATSHAAETPPPWAYGLSDATPSPAVVSPPRVVPPEMRAYGLAGATLQFTQAQINDRFGPADWFPGDHPAMPVVVAKGRKPDVTACAMCHYPNGKGRPDSAPLAGLPVNYFIAQMHAFRDGTRHSADPRKTDTAAMAAIARNLTEPEIRAAAEYYGALHLTPSTRVVESKTVPETTVQQGLFLPVAGGKQEPIGMRIIEVPENVEAVTVLRNPRAGFTAYVPQGYVNRGAVVVTTGRGKTAPCATCHGSDLKGRGDVPGIIGRSPSYLMRQMVDMRNHTRTGPGAEAMKPVTGAMSNVDMLAVAAFLASRSP